jgi:hypothetical protein
MARRFVESYMLRLLDRDSSCCYWYPSTGIQSFRNYKRRRILLMGHGMAEESGRRITWDRTLIYVWGGRCFTWITL